MKLILQKVLNNGLIFLFLLPVTFVAEAQELRFSDPVILGPAVNSKSEELSPVLSPDGKKLYFSRAFYGGNTGGTYAGMDVWVSDRKGDKEWSLATNELRSINNRDNNAVLGIKSDGNTIYLLNTYHNQKGIGFSRKVFSGWSAPEIIEVPNINKNDFLGFYMSPAYDVLLISMKGEDSLGEEDLYVSIKDANGMWGEPINLGSTINSAGFEISPFLSPDKKKLFFASNGHGGYGDADIFVSERLYNSWILWSAPRNLGSKINSGGFDAYLNMAEDSTVVFASNRGGEMADLYQCQFLGPVNERVALKKTLIAEAKDILSELRGEKQYFIEFENSSSEFSEEGKKNLSDLIKDLNYQYYSEINLISFDKNSSEVNETRVNRIVDYLKVSGINEKKISVSKDGEYASALPNKEHGVLIVISKLN